LLILSGPELGTAVELGNVPFELGRDPDCAVTADERRGQS